MESLDLIVSGLRFNFQGSWPDLLQTLEILNALDSPDAFCFQHFYFFKPKNISSPFFTVYNRSDLSTPGIVNLVSCDPSLKRGACPIHNM